MRTRFYGTGFVCSSLLLGYWGTDIYDKIDDGVPARKILLKDVPKIVLTTVLAAVCADGFLKYY